MTAFNRVLPLVAGLTLALTAALTLLSLAPRPADPGTLESHIYHFSLTSTRWQVISHAVALLILAVAGLRIMARAPGWMAGDPISRIGASFLPVSILLLTLVTTANGTTRLIVLLAALVSAAMVWYRPITLFGRFARHWARIGRVGGNLPVKVALGLALIAAVLALQIAPLGTPIHLADIFDKIAFETHYAMTVLPALDILHGKGAWRANYGPGMLLATTGIAATAQGWIDDPLELLARSVQIAQTLATVLVIVLFRLLDRGSWIWLSLLALLVCAFSLAGYGPAVLHPNQAGIRYLPFVMGLIGLAVFTRAPVRAVPWLLGALAGVVLALAPDIGLAVGMGAIVGAGLRCWRQDHPVSGLARTLLVLGIAAIGSWLLAATLAGWWVGRSDGAGGGLFLQFLGGYGGWTDRPSLTAMVVFLLGGVLILQACARVAAGRPHRADALRAALAATSLVWLGYYMNRMGEWNLWFQGILLLAMLAPRWRPMAVLRALAPRDRPPSPALTSGALAIALLLGLGIESTGRIAPYMHAGCPPPKVEARGFCHDAVHAGDYLAKLRDLPVVASRHAPGLVLSVAPTEVRTLGYNADLPWYDVFGEVVTLDQARLFSEWLAAQGPDMLVTDATVSSISAHAYPRGNQIRDHVEASGVYQVIEEGPHWAVWRRQR